MAQKETQTLLREAIAALDSMQKKLDEAERYKNDPVAVIGIGCRFPGGIHGPDAFWDLLRDGVDAISEVPCDRWDVDSYYDPDPEAPGKMYTRNGGFIDSVDMFDPLFFGISPREARTLDPQQRLMLEVSWEALEHAAIDPGSLRESQTGVFVGIGGSDFSNMQLCKSSDEQIDAYTGSGGGVCFAAGRVSFALGLQGPSAVVDTACSSSLLATHLACQSLRTGECTMALAGGVNLMLSPVKTIYLSRLKALSPDGRSKTFDASADGFSRGEGCGVIVLKRLSNARRDGDRVLAVIRGAAVNQDGPSSGLTVPNGSAQSAVIRTALANAGMRPEDISYLESHGDTAW